MPRTRNPYPTAFREQIVELHRAGRSAEDLAREFEAFQDVPWAALYRELDEAALSAAMRWRFKPGIKGGRKAITTAVQPFTFRVKS